MLSHKHVSEKTWTEILTIVYNNMKRNIMQIKWSADVKWLILDANQYWMSAFQILLEIQKKTARELES